MDRLIRNLHLLWRAESLIVSLKVQRASKGWALWLCAVLAGLFGLAMLNLAGFFALQPGMGAVAAALLVAAADLVIAVLAIVLARQIGTSPELNSALETRQAALAELEAELAAMQAEIRAVRDDFASMKATVTSFIHRPLDSPLLAMILPLVKSLTKLRRPGKE